MAEALQQERQRHERARMENNVVEVPAAVGDQRGQRILVRGGLELQPQDGHATFGRLQVAAESELAIDERLNRGPILQRNSRAGWHEVHEQYGASGFRSQCVAESLGKE